MSSTPPVPRLKKMVELMLDENPTWQGIQVRNSDIALTVVIWQRWYSVGTNDDSVVHLKRLLDLPREDNVKRVRAYFQNTEHKYLPTDVNVLKARKIEQEYWEEALGYKLSPEEWRRHHQTVRENKPPNLDYGHAPTPVKGRFETKPTADGGIEVTAVRTTKMQAIYLQRHYSSGGIEMGKQYELEVEQLVTGKPIKLVAPVVVEYPNLQAFARAWKVVG